jgi:hypothetical protein
MDNAVGGLALLGCEADHRYVRWMASVSWGKNGCLVPAMELMAHDCILSLSRW